MAETEGSMAPALGEYHHPDLVGLRVSVPRGLLPSPVLEAKRQRHLRRAILTTTAGLAVTAASGWVAHLIAGEAMPGRYWLAIVVVIAVARAITQWRANRGEISRSPGFTDETAGAFRLATLGSLIGATATVSAESILPLHYPRGLLLSEWAFGVLFWTALLVGMKIVANRLRSSERNTRQILVVGSTATSRRLIEHVSRHPESGYRLAGVVSFDVATDSDRARNDGNGDRDLPSLMADLFIDDLVFSSSVPPHQVIRILARCNPRLKVHQVSLSADAPVLRTGASMAGFPVVNLLHPSLSPSGAVLKRTVDVVVASLALVLAAPIVVLAGALIKLSSRGPAFFRQTRIGQHGRAFTLYKLRTMRFDTDTNIHKEYVRQLMVGAMIEASNGLFKPEQPGITPVGRVLRRLSIDEIPQLWNVLNGSMSIVGPRPPMPYEIPNHDSRQLRRLDMRPGLTGLWQVSGRNKMGYREMVELDLRYIDNWSLGGDLRIILRTPSAIFRDRDTT